MSKSVCLSAIIQILLSVSSGFAQELSGPGPKKARTPDDYTVRTLKEIAAKSEGQGTDRDKNGGAVFGNLLPSRVRVTFKGSNRTLPDRRRTLLHRWAQLYAGAPQHYTVHYQSEMLFSEAGTSYWITVKKDLLKQLKAELKRGDSVELFLIRLGSADGTRGKEPLLLAESFQKWK